MPSTTKSQENKLNEQYKRDGGRWEEVLRHQKNGFLQKKDEKCFRKSTKDAMEYKL